MFFLCILISAWLSTLIFQTDCELPQLHLLSVKMEANLHHGCPPNCQDLITWLPTNQATHILSYLDPGIHTHLLYKFNKDHSGCLSQLKYWKMHIGQLIGTESSKMSNMSLKSCSIPSLL